MSVCIIPARGGSNRIPRKNIKPFCGKPIIAWSIEAAFASRLFTSVIVSTDDSEIAAVAKSFGAAAPFQRPPELSDDHATSLAVMQHAVRWLEAQGVSPETACCLYPTAPLVQARDLVMAADALSTSGADFAFPVTSFAFPIQRALRRNNEGRVAMFHPEDQLTRSQDLEPAYHDAGQFYWGTTAAWLEGRPVYGGKTTTLVLPRYRVQDIDTEEDWLRAEFISRLLQDDSHDRQVNEQGRSR